MHESSLTGPQSIPVACFSSSILLSRKAGRYSSGILDRSSSTLQSADDESGVVLDNLGLYVDLQAKQAEKPVKGAGLCPGSFQRHFLFTWLIIIRVGYTISHTILSDAIALSWGD